MDTHSDFLVKITQWDAPGEIQDKVFDDWMMDTKSKRGSLMDIGAGAMTGVMYTENILQR